MQLTRRRVMWMVAGSAIGLSGHSRSGVSVLLDTRNGLAQESAAGYRRVLDHAGHPVETAYDVSSCHFQTVLVPAGRAATEHDFFVLRQLAKTGHHVLVESGLAFMDVPEVRQQVALAKKFLGFSIAPHGLASAQSTLYLEYHWPVNVMVRQFGPPACVNGPHCRSIARIHGRSVAAVRSLGSGKITFLGSPLGPALLAEDREATAVARWLLTI